MAGETARRHGSHGGGPHSWQSRVVGLEWWAPSPSLFFLCHLPEILPPMTCQPAHVAISKCCKLTVVQFLGGEANEPVEF